MPLGRPRELNRTIQNHSRSPRFTTLLSDKSRGFQVQATIKQETPYGDRYVKLLGPRNSTYSKQIHTLQMTTWVLRTFQICFLHVTFVRSPNFLLFLFGKIQNTPHSTAYHQPHLHSNPPHNTWNKAEMSKYQLVMPHVKHNSLSSSNPSASQGEHQHHPSSALHTGTTRVCQPVAALQNGTELKN